MRSRRIPIAIKLPAATLDTAGTLEGSFHHRARTPLHHRIMPTPRQRMTPQHPPRRHPSSAQRAKTLHRLHRIFRTSRHIPASRRKHGRNRPLVPPQHYQHNVLSKFAHELPCHPERSMIVRRTVMRSRRTPIASQLSMTAKGIFHHRESAMNPASGSHPYRAPAPPLFTLCSITTNARFTSFSTTANSAASNDFFGLITTSTAPA